MKYEKIGYIKLKGTNKLYKKDVYQKGKKKYIKIGNKYYEKPKGEKVFGKA